MLLEDMSPILQDVLIHYGVKRRSGRYPWGSGDSPYQRSGDWLSRVDELKKEGMSDSEIQQYFGYSSGEFRRFKSIAKDERRQYDADRARSLREDGKSLTEIAQIMGYSNESSIRNLLKERENAKSDASKNTAEFLKKMVDERGMIDVGKGVNAQLNISKEMMDTAITRLELQGYKVYGIDIPQINNPGKNSRVMVLAPPGTEYSDVYKNSNKIRAVQEDWTSHDGGMSFDPKWVYPKSMDSKRLMVNYADTDGDLKDGVIELRRGCKDLDLGGSHYSQVRILVDGTHYLKGMAVYADDLPDGVDIRFNTNKKSGTPALGPKNNTVLKPIKDDPDNPFGSAIMPGINDPDKLGNKKGGQSYYYDENGKKQLSLINKRADEGSWDDWAKKVPSQFLSKQNKALIEKQLDLTLADRKLELETIKSINNPALKKAMLMSFAGDCDSSAVHLQAAALPRQKYQVILPLKSIKDTEVYAPQFRDGETVALVRYPHGGTFEIPILKVNNKNQEGRKVITPNAKDAVGITKKVADRLSGADFDGDTVMVIPCNSSRSKVRITSTKPLEDLKDFDPKVEYGGRKEGTFTPMKKQNVQKQMGMISNLITDMTLKGATEKELARAVRHSMVVIDAEKHKLDYKQSEKDHGIKELKKKYQGHYDENGRYREGAATLISSAKSPVRINKRVGAPSMEEMRKTGKIVYKQVEETYVDKNGKTKVRQIEVPKMSVVDDANKLSSGTHVERMYANYANTLKGMANSSRKEAANMVMPKVNKSAAETYKTEVKSLEDKLKRSEMNAPRERQAQMLANSILKSKINENPDMGKEDKKKAGQQALVYARTKVHAQRQEIEITDKEWEAIQAGAISASKQSAIFLKADQDKLKERAMPRGNKTELSQAKINKMQTMKASGYTTTEIAEALGVSTSTINKYL